VDRQVDLLARFMHDHVVNLYFRGVDAEQAADLAVDLVNQNPALESFGTADEHLLLAVEGGSWEFVGMDAAGLGVADEQDVLGAKCQRAGRFQVFDVSRQGGQRHKCADRKDRACISHLRFKRMRPLVRP
jgi:hypothetical protein